MPMDRSKYPANWKEISLHIRERDGWKCKWCGLHNGAVGYREENGKFIKLYNSADDVDMQAEVLELIDGVKIITIVLTVAHINHDVSDNSDSNLVALCQKCHLSHDAKIHAKHSMETRLKRKEELYCGRLFDV